MIDRRTFSTQALVASAALALPMINRGASAAPSSREGMADVPGGRVWWRRLGSGPKTPLLVLHGGPGAGHDYLLPLAVLANERPVIFYDQLGCGRSDSPADPSVYTIQRSVDEVDAVRRALGLRDVILFGHSWGTILTLEYLCQGRGKGVKSIMLAGAIPATQQFVAGTKRLLAQLPGHAGERIEQLDRAGGGGTPEYQALVQGFYDRHLCRRRPLPPEVVKTFDNLGRSIAYRVMNGPNEFTVTGVIRDWDRRADLSRIGVPTLLTTGQYDEVTLDCHQTIQRSVKGSVLKVLPDCSHLTMNEKPAEYVALLRKFMSGSVKG